MAIYKVIEPLNHDGKRYAINSFIELENAADLVAAGVLEAVGSESGNAEQLALIAAELELMPKDEKVNVLALSNKLGFFVSHEALAAAQAKKPAKGDK